MYTVEEKVFWIEKYLSGSTLREVCAKFHEKYPDRPKPNCSTVKRCYDRFKATGNVQYEQKGKKRPQRKDSMNKLVILASVSADPRRSTNDIARETGLSQATVWRQLRKCEYKPYKVQSSQELRPGDAETAVETSTEEPDSKENILTDGSSCIHHSPSRQNTRLWLQNEPHSVDASDTQYSKEGITSFSLTHFLEDDS